MSVQANTEKSINGVPVKGDVRIVPAKRTAVYDVVLGKDRVEKGRKVYAPKMTARVNAKSITLGGSSDIPRTLAAVDAIAALVAAVREELVTQGVTE